MTRNIRMVVTPVVLLALLFGLYSFGKWGYEQATTKIPARGAAPCVATDVGDELTPNRVTLRVFNAGEKSNQARLTAAYLRSFDFRVLRYGNADQKVEKPVVIGNAVDDPEVLLLLGFFKDAVAQADGRPDHIIDVLLPTSLVRIEKPITKLKVDGPVCLPKVTTSATPATSPSASPSPDPSPAKKKK